MREVADAEKIRRFMQALGAEATADARIYFAGGTTAVLIGWRPNTIDIDMKIVPEDDRVLRAIPALKERLHTNVELASPADFIPVPAGWEERGAYIATEGKLSFFHFDFNAQALAKVERGHRQDLEDVREMIRRELITPSVAIEYFESIEPNLYRFPAIDPASFRRAVEEIFGA